MVGAGEHLSYLPKHGKYYGLDTSIDMLKRCKKRIKSKGIDASFIMSAAESLPFASDVFDLVFSVCAFRQIVEKSKAFEEMVRVAKPGTRIMVIDQTKAGVALGYIPKEIEEINVKEQPWGLYCLRYKKPKIKRGSILGW